MKNKVNKIMNFYFKINKIRQNNNLNLRLTKYYKRMMKMNK